MERARRLDVKLHFPVDFVAAHRPEDESNVRLFNCTQGIPDDYMVVKFAILIIS